MSVDAQLPPGDGRPLGLGPHLESFVNGLRVAGYASRTVRSKRCAAARFLKWLQEEQISVFDADKSHVAAFIERGPRRSKHRYALERAAARGLVEHVRDGGAAPRSLADLTSASTALEKDYADYLRNERGLSAGSVRTYLPVVTDFVGAWAAAFGSDSPVTPDAQVVRDFLLDRISDWSCGYAKFLASVLRSFLRFLFLRGETALDLSHAVPTVRRRRLANLPVILSPSEVEQVLSTTDRTTKGGRRNHAILLLLARLGLRAGEVTALELGDIRWRTAEIVIRGKGAALDRLPLLSDVGEALSVYIRDRGPSASRRVFLREVVPSVGFTGPSAVSSVARIALSRAGLRLSHRGAAHLFRHSLATRMLRSGASMTEIAEILRHRSTATTEIYAKVAFESLRGVARPWPGTEDVR
ncbi:MAG: integrase/recombinase XerD [Myxococcota bacterium]|jgi:integrase/recombinase XerD